ncbi:MAG: DegQ family serine endoprotease [Tranquillimonas sp.]
MSNNPKSRRKRTALLTGAALSVLATFGTPALRSAYAETTAPATTATAPAQQTQTARQSLLTPDGSFSEIVKKARPAVVTITTERQLGAADVADRPGMPGMQGLPNGTPFDEFFQRFFGPNGPQGGQPMPGQPMPGHPQGPQTARALGSGFIVDPDGLIVTNNHVIDGASKIEVVLDDGRQFPATLVGRDAKTDLAVLKVDAGAPLPAVAWGDSDMLEAGDRVIAIGNPFGVGTSVSAGIVSARGRDLHNGPYDDFLQIDAALNHGNSGGPLLDAYGQVVGVSNAIFSPNDGNVGLGFAIPSDMAKQIVAELADKGSIERGYLGVQIQPVTRDIAQALGLDDVSGAMVVEVQPDTPAEKAGLLPGDIVRSVDGRPVADPRALSRAIANLDPGATPALEVWRGGETVDMGVTLAALPNDAGMPVTAPAQQQDRTPGADVPQLGLSLSELTPEMRAEFGLPADRQGLVVTDLGQGFSSDADIRPGDIILSVNSKDVTTVQDVRQGVQQAIEAKRPSVLMMIERGGNRMFVAVPVGHA